MAFGADEVRVLRRALAQVLHPPKQTFAHPAPSNDRRSVRGHDRAPADWIPADRAPEDRGAWIEDVQEVLRLAQAIDEAVDEAGRMRAFALADLARYRHALPGSAAGYLERLRDAVADGYVPDSDDLSAMRTLTALPCAPEERVRRLALRSRCGELAEAAVRRRLTAPPPPARIAARALPSGVADVRVAGLRAESLRAEGSRAESLRVQGPRAAIARADNVTEFARPGRAPRPRDLTRPFPIRPGGPVAMDSYESTPRPADQPPAETEPKDGPARPIPTPGDLWPRGVRRGADEDAELPTGTG